MKGIVTNVRKKGRPHVVDPQELRKIYGPALSDRSMYERSRSLRSMRVLIKAAGEVPRIALGDGVGCRPRTSKRFPWIMGHRLQRTILFELSFIESPKWRLKYADRIEKFHRASGMTAKQAREYIRNVRREYSFSGPEEF